MGYDLRHGLGQARRQGPVPAVRVRRRRIKVSIETRFLFFLILEDISPLCVMGPLIPLF